MSPVVNSPRPAAARWPPSPLLEPSPPRSSSAPNAAAPRPATAAAPPAPPARAPATAPTQYAGPSYKVTGRPAWFFRVHRSAPPGGRPFSRRAATTEPRAPMAKAPRPLRLRPANARARSHRSPFTVGPPSPPGHCVAVRSGRIALASEPRPYCPTPPVYCCPRAITRVPSPMGRSASSTVEITLRASESLRTPATRSADLVRSAVLDLAATTSPDPAASSRRESCTYDASRALLSCWVEPLTGPPRKTTLEDGTIWSGE